MYKKILKNNQANFIIGLVTIIGVMIATVVAAIVFFAFADAGQDVSNQTETFTIDDVATVEHYNVSTTPDSTTPEWVVTANNNATPVPSANLTISGGYVQVDANVWGSGNTTATISYNARSYSSVGDVITYAIIVFTLMAIIPLIFIGGMMLRSLGYFGGGKP